MNRNDLLNVWFEQRIVGKLSRDKFGNLGFQYDKEWLNNGFPISQQLPLSVENTSSTNSKAHQFFANLLPEANARMHIVRDLKIANSDFELLKAIGGECAGALSILPTHHKPGTNIGYKKLSDENLTTLLLRKGNIINFVSEKNRPRLSLAGAQDKCPVLYDGKDYFLPQDASPSTHIIKFEMSDYRHIPAYEYFLTQLANTIGLPTVETEFKQRDDHSFLLVKRYDRIITSAKNIIRLHQEDFCQALGLGYEHKYEQDGGPSFHDCYKLIQRVSSNPITDAESLLKWQIFNYLAGNSDGHAKNLALLYFDQQQVRLAPFYDLVCTRAIERIDHKLALSVGGEFNPGNVTNAHWEKLSQQCNIRFKYLLDTLSEIAITLLDQIEPAKRQFEKIHGGYPALQRVERIVTKQCKQTLNKIKKHI